MMRAPEILAPAGDRACLEAAVHAGADAVYFGLQGFNARARAANFDSAGLAETLVALEILKGLLRRLGHGAPLLAALRVE